MQMPATAAERRHGTPNGNIRHIIRFWATSDKRQSNRNHHTPAAGYYTTLNVVQPLLSTPETAANMDHSHMDHGDMNHHGGMSHGDMDMPTCSMNMVFTWDSSNLCIVFRSWRITSTASLLISLLAIVALTAAYELVREASRRYEERIRQRVEALPSKCSLCVHCDAPVAALSIHLSFPTLGHSIVLLFRCPVLVFPGASALRGVPR